MRERAPAGLSSRTLLGGAALVGGSAALAGLAPILGEAWIALARHGLSGRGVSGGAWALVVEAEAVAALTLAPPLACALVAAMVFGGLQTLGRPGSTAARALREAIDVRRDRRAGLARTLANGLLTAALVLVAVELERAPIRAALQGDTPSLLAATGWIAGRLALRVGIGLAAIGLAEHALARLSLRAWLAERARTSARDGEVADPRLRAELRRRQREQA